jgi:hypothetical protein
MFVRLVKLNERQINGEISYYLSEVSINVMQITYISENHQYKRMLSEGKLNIDLNIGAHFTDLKLNANQVVTVIGTPSMIETKILSNTNKQLLKG